MSPPHPCRRLLLACWLLGGLHLSFAVLPGEEAAAAEPVKWLTGQRLETQLLQESGVLWSESPFRQGLERLSQTHQVAILMDRRVDPDFEVTMALQAQPLRDAFSAIAAKRQLGVSLLGPVAYFGPPATAARLRTVAALRKDEMGKLPTAARQAFSRQRTWRWDDLATPRELIEQLSREGRFETRGAKSLPHDLWAAADLPPLALVDRLTLVLAQFDATFRFEDEGKAITLVPLPEQVAVERTYPGASKPADLAAKWTKLLPNCEIDVQGKQIRVRGRIEDHERIDVRRSGRTIRTRVTSEEERRYTLKVKDQPIGKLLEQLGRQLELTIRTDAAEWEKAGISPEHRVTFSVTDATLDGLLKEAVTPAGLVVERHDRTVDVRPGKIP